MGHPIPQYPPKVNPSSTFPISEGGELDILGNEFTIDKLSVSSNRPAEASEDQTGSQRHINDNLLLGRLLIISNGD